MNHTPYISVEVCAGNGPEIANESNIYPNGCQVSISYLLSHEIKNKNKKHSLQEKWNKVD